MKKIISLGRQTGNVLQKMLRSDEATKFLEMWNKPLGAHQDDGGLSSEVFKGKTWHIHRPATDGQSELEFDGLVKRTPVSGGARVKGWELAGCMTIHGKPYVGIWRVPQITCQEQPNAQVRLFCSDQALKDHMDSSESSEPLISFSGTIKNMLPQSGTIHYGPAFPFDIHRGHSFRGEIIHKTTDFETDIKTNVAFLPEGEGMYTFNESDPYGRDYFVGNITHDSGINVDLVGNDGSMGFKGLMHNDYEVQAKYTGAFDGNMLPKGEGRFEFVYSGGTYAYLEGTTNVSIESDQAKFVLTGTMKANNQSKEKAQSPGIEGTWEVFGKAAKMKSSQNKRHANITFKNKTGDTINYEGELDDDLLLPLGQGRINVISSDEERVLIFEGKVLSTPFHSGPWELVGKMVIGKKSYWGAWQVPDITMARQKNALVQLNRMADIGTDQPSHTLNVTFSGVVKNMLPKHGILMVTEKAGSGRDEVLFFGPLNDSFQAHGRGERYKIGKTVNFSGGEWKNGKLCGGSRVYRQMFGQKFGLHVDVIPKGGPKEIFFNLVPFWLKGKDLYMDSFPDNFDAVTMHAPTEEFLRSNGAERDGLIRKGKVTTRYQRINIRSGALEFELDHKVRANIRHFKEDRAALYELEDISKKFHDGRDGVCKRLIDYARGKGIVEKTSTKHPMKVVAEIEKKLENRNDGSSEWKAYKSAKEKLKKLNDKYEKARRKVNMGLPIHEVGVPPTVRDLLEGKIVPVVAAVPPRLAAWQEKHGK